MKYKLSKQALDNAKLNIQEMKEHKIKLESFPFKLHIEPTQKCNLDCKMCWDGRRRSKKEIDMKLYKKIEKELFPYMSEVNFFLIGEPLLAKNLYEMISVVENYSFLPKIFTNATIYSEKLFRKMIELGFFLNISMDAATKEKFEEIRKGANYEQFVENIKKIKALADEINNPRFHIRLVQTAGSYNVEETPNIIEFAKKHGIRDVMVNDCDMGKPHSYNLASNKEKAKKNLNEAMNLANKYKIRFSAPKFTGEEKLLEKNHNWDDFKLPIDKFAPSYLEEYNPRDGDCPYTWIETAIRLNGDVTSCCQKLVKMGNMKKKSFKEIWNNRKYQKMRKKESYYNCQGYCLLTRNSIWKGEKSR